MTETCPNCGEELTSDNAAGGLCGRCLFERGIELTNTVAVAEGSTPGTHPFAAPDPVEVEADLLSFDVLELIGQGGMGAVYKAYQRSLDRTVAIKILPRQATGGHEFAERFQREARALARLRHENIVMAYDYGLTDRYLYSVMEYVGGPNLRQHLRNQPVEPRRALEIVRDVCAALQFAHENGIVHRDIKPENILLDDTGRVKIADFGLAKLLQPDPRDLALTHTRHFMGTVHYMAPEQSERPHETDHRADIYSVGVVLYEMLTGELPIGRFDAPSSRADVDERIDDLVFRALEKDPARRYDTAAAFREAIQRELEVATGGHRLTRSMPAAENSSLLAGETGSGAKPQAIKSSSFSDRGHPRRGPLIAAGFFAFLVVAYFGWQFLLKYQSDKDGNTTLTVEAKGGEEAASKSVVKGPTSMRASDAPSKSESAKTTKRRKSTDASDTGGLIGPVQIEYLEGLDQIVLRGDPEDVRRTIELIKHIEGHVQGKQNETPEDLIRRLRDSGAKDKPGTPQTEQLLQVFQLKYVKASEITDELRTILGTDAGRFEPDNRTNSIIALADRESMSRVQALLKRLDQSAPQTDLLGTWDPPADVSELDRQIEVLQLEIKKVTAEIERSKAALSRLDDKVDTPQILTAKLRAHGDLEKAESTLKALQAEKSIAERELAGLKARIDAIDKGEFPEALLMSEIRSDPELIELRKEIAEATNRYRQAKSVATEPQSNAAVQRTAARLKELRETEDRLIAELREIALAKLRFGNTGQPGKSRKTEGETSNERDRSEAKDQVKIFQLQNSKASEAEQMLRKLYPDNSAVRMTADGRTNSLIVEGDRETLTVIEAILLRLDESGSSNTDDGPTTITRRHVLRISAAGTSPEAPIDGRYNIDLDGYVNLGGLYGKIKVVGLTAEQAQDAILEKLRETLRAPKVVLSIESGSLPAQREGAVEDPESASPIRIEREAHVLRIRAAGTVAEAPIDGLYNLDLDGYVNLGAHYGKIKVAGMTADEAEKAILAELSKVLRNPKVVLTIEERSQGQPPIRISAQIRRDDLTLRVPFKIEGKLAGGLARYYLVADGPRMGRVEFEVTAAMGQSGYGPAAYSGEGLLTSDKGLSIASGEAIEVFIEEKANRQGANPIRVSNIVNLSWDLPESGTEATSPSRAESQDKSGSKATFQLKKNKSSEVADILRRRYPDLSTKITANEESNTVTVEADQTTLAEVLAIIQYQSVPDDWRGEPFVKRWFESVAADIDRTKSQIETRQTELTNLLRMSNVADVNELPRELRRFGELLQNHARLLQERLTMSQQLKRDLEPLVSALQSNDWTSSRAAEFTLMLSNAHRIETFRLTDINKQVSEKRQELDELRNKSLDYRKDLLVLRAYSDLLGLVERENELTAKSNARLPNWSQKLTKLKPPIAITSRIDRENRMLLVPFSVDPSATIPDRPHFLVVSGPKVGRIEFPLNKPFAGNEYRLGPGDEGVFASSKGLSIPTGEAIEAFIEEKANRQGAKPVRVSNILELTWDLPSVSRQENEATEDNPKAVPPSTQEAKESGPD